MPAELTWGPLGAASASDVADLAERCRAVDGGLTEVAISRYRDSDAITSAGRTAAGELVAVAVVRRVGERAMITGMVDPAHRGVGVGSRLLDWALAAAGTFTSDVVLETEAVTPEAERLFESRGLRQVFAEDVMRIDLSTDLPLVPVPAGVRMITWAPETVARFFAVHEAAFRERPGFPGWPAERWVAWTAGDDEFRPDWSLLATEAPESIIDAAPESAADLGFVTCADGWIVQVGVRPEARGRGIATALVVEALRRMRADGATAALLDVNVNNPGAARLYARLGFSVLGRRARFEPVRAS
ncbi:GNAT family N-acetyltransferase [Micromonospora sp. CPCC 206061]|uniref:GNAT family N-acetyltransferase n=1 Tax=Micromonospora sp. CPCC 206061 TaxID=3122410 RepID=UPI002FF1549E